MLFTVKPSTSTAKLIGFQILFGTGIGSALQNTVCTPPPFELYNGFILIRGHGVLDLGRASGICLATRPCRASDFDLHLFSITRAFNWDRVS